MQQQGRDPSAARGVSHPLVEWLGLRLPRPAFGYGAPRRRHLLVPEDPYGPEQLFLASYQRERGHCRCVPNLVWPCEVHGSVSRPPFGERNSDRELLEWNRRPVGVFGQEARRPLGGGQLARLGELHPEDSLGRRVVEDDPPRPVVYRHGHREVRCEPTGEDESQALLLPHLDRHARAKRNVPARLARDAGASGRKAASTRALGPQRESQTFPNRVRVVRTRRS